MLMVTAFVRGCTFRLRQGSQEKALFLGWRLVVAGMMLITP